MMATAIDKLEYSNLIEFVRPTSDGSTSSVTRAAYVKLSQPAINGVEARLFYENLCVAETPNRTCLSACKPEKQTNSSSHDIVCTNSRVSAEQGCKQSRSPVKNHVQGQSLPDVDFNSGTHQRTLLEKGATETIEKVHPLMNAATGTVNSTSVCMHKRVKKSKPKRKDKGKCTKADMSQEQAHSRTPCQKVNKRVVEHRHSEVLRFAQNGDVDEVTNLLHLGVNINFQDIYGWTAAMSAAYEGHVKVLRCLIRAGADLDICNSQGHSALSLAKSKHHTHVVELLESIHMGIGMVHSRSKSPGKQNSSFYCDVCKTEFTDMDQNTHLRSTVHLFNTGKKPKDDSFMIPSSNMGYRLMLKSGWDAQKGLGPSGQGPKFPVKTYLKTDRKGLGNEVKEKARVTHFKPHDCSAVERHGGVHSRVENVRTLSRRAQRVKEKRDRKWEIEMRRRLT